MRHGPTRTNETHSDQWDQWSPYGAHGPKHEAQALAQGENVRGPQAPARTTGPPWARILTLGLSLGPRFGAMGPIWDPIWIPYWIPYVVQISGLRYMYPSFARCLMHPTSGLLVLLHVRQVRLLGIRRDCLSAWPSRAPWSL